MLADLILALKNAKTPEEKEKAYRNLEYVGMDRMTANILLSDSEANKVLSEMEEK